MHLVGFTIEIRVYYDARTYERQKKAMCEGKWLSSVHHVRLQICMVEYKLQTTQNNRYIVSYIFTLQKNKMLISS